MLWWSISCHTCVTRMHTRAALRACMHVTYKLNKTRAFGSDLLIGPRPSELSSETAFRIFPIAHQYELRTILLWCGEAVDRGGPLALWPSTPIASSEVSSHPGLVQWLALADSKHCAPLVESCLSQLLPSDSNDTIRRALVSPRLCKLIDGMHSDTMTNIMRKMAGLPLGVKVNISTGGYMMMAEVEARLGK